MNKKAPGSRPGAGVTKLGSNRRQHSRNSRARASRVLPFPGPAVDIDAWKEGKPAAGSSPKLSAHFREIAKQDEKTNPILTIKAVLRTRIANDAKLVSDFEFFTTALEWSTEQFLQWLCMDAGLLTAPRRSPAASVKKIQLRGGKQIRLHAEKLATEIVRLKFAGEKDKSKLSVFSPARTVVLRNETEPTSIPSARQWPFSHAQLKALADEGVRVVGVDGGARLNRNREKFFLKAFAELPDILRAYSRELHRKMQVGSVERESSDWQTLSGLLRRHSLYETIRSKLGKYHKDRLRRLVNAARNVSGLPEIKTKAFTVSLSRLKKRMTKPSSIPNV